MTTKQHNFTYDELVALREATTTEFLRIRDHIEQCAFEGQEVSDRANRGLRILEALKIQFTEDVRLFR